MTFNGTSLCCVLSISTLLTPASCAVGSHPGDAQISYHLAVIENDFLEVEADECNVEATETLTYRYPSGDQATIRAARDPVFAVPLDDSVSVRLVDFLGAKSPEMRIVTAEVIPAEPALRQATAVRRTFLRCDLLIVLDGNAVGIERRGRDWSRLLPAGRFSSMEAAERAFSKSGAIVRREVPLAEELRAQDDFWVWRKQKDLWDFHCDQTIREAIRTKNPQLYEALQKTPAPDCQSPPIMPEEGYAIDEE